MGRPFKYIQSVFNRGELSPRIIGRVDIDAYYNATKYSDNMLPFPQGAITKRPGTYFVSTVKTSSLTTTLIPFKFSTVQNYIIEVGNLYFRFYRNRGVVESSPGVAYELVTPWPTAVLRELKFVQSYDRLYVFHKDYQPRVITRTSDTAWTINTLTFDDGPFLPVNATTTTMAPSAATGAITITASVATFVAGDVGRQIRIKVGASNWGYANITGFTSTTQVSATVVNTFTTFAATTSWALSYTGGTQGWPSVGSIYEQRMIMANMANYPATLFGTETGGFGTTAKFSPSGPTGTVTDSNGFVYTIGDDQVNDIRWLSSGRIMMIGTAGGEHSMTGGTSSSYAPVTPSNVTIKRESKTGSALNGRAHRVGSAILYTSRSGLKVRELNYDFGIDSFISRDVTIFNDHITHTGVLDSDFQDEPDPTMWGVLNSGELIGFSYERTQQVEGWHRHNLGGVDTAVKAVACIPKPAGDGDDVWLIVSRTINGATVQTVEYITDYFDGANDGKDSAFFVDCGATYNGYLAATLTPGATTGTGVTFTAGSSVFTAAMVGDQIRYGSSRAIISGYTSGTQVTATITVDFPSISPIASGDWSVATMNVTGLTWLEGETVSILADGYYAGQDTVASGEVEITAFASKIHVGLPYTAELQTLPIEVKQMGTIAGNIRRTHRVFLYLTETIGLIINNVINAATQVVPFGGGTHDLDDGPDLFNGVLTTEPPMDYDELGIMKITHTWPTNLTINYIAQEMVIND
jgi:hypothetical protein